MPYFYFDYWYLVLIVPALIIGAIAQAKVSSTYSRYSSVFSRRGMTAEMAARYILDKNGLYHVAIRRVPGKLTDHYDPRSNTVNLSDSVYGSTSVAAIGVAAHEVGHAVQHAENYMPLTVRNAIIPVTRFGSGIAPFLIVFGFVFFQPLVTIGIILYSAVTVFQLVTLPVEFNASSRAMKVLESDGLLQGEELAGARKVLSAAAMTYVAALIMSAASLLRMILIYGRRNRD